jgi:hypothetical protein
MTDGCVGKPIMNFFACSSSVPLARNRLGDKSMTLLAGVGSSFWSACLRWCLWRSARRGRVPGAIDRICPKPDLRTFTAGPSGKPGWNPPDLSQGPVPLTGAKESPQSSMNQRALSRAYGGEMANKSTSADRRIDRRSVLQAGAAALAAAGPAVLRRAHAEAQPQHRGASR